MIPTASIHKLDLLSKMLISLLKTKSLEYFIPREKWGQACIMAEGHGEHAMTDFVTVTDS